MNDASPNTYGLFELDTAGTVLYSKINRRSSTANLPADLIGLNFFDEIAPFKNIEEFRRRFRYFAKGSETAERFTFSSELEENRVELNVMLTRISEREFDGEKKLIIVDIRFGN